MSAATVIYRCSKRCEAAAGRKVALRVIFQEERHYGPPDRVYGSRRLLSIDYTAPSGERFLRYAPHQLPALPCALCGRSMLGRRVSGHVNPDVPCDARCTGATGHHCECSCGGKNHGADHGGGLAVSATDPATPAAIPATVPLFSHTAQSIPPPATDPGAAQ